MCAKHQKHSRSPVQEEEERRSKLGSHCPAQVGYVGVSAPSCSSGSFSPSSMRAGPSHLCGWNQHGFQEVASGSQRVTKRLRHLVTSSHGLRSGTKVPAQRNNQNDQTISCSVMFDSWWPLDDSPPGSYVHWILQAWILEWAALPFSRGSSRPGNEHRSPALQADSFTVWATGDIANFVGNLQLPCLSSMAASPFPVSCPPFLLTFASVESSETLSLPTPWSDFTPRGFTLECPTRGPVPRSSSGVAAGLPCIQVSGRTSSSSARPCCPFSWSIWQALKQSLACCPLHKPLY